ncbi:hypothetical protein METBIDRAFT_39641 [Metschnikowia bicuspidata var. bicuspidata NRRL YB-4993]|uniref:Pre-mRNA-splicing factor SYF2 n=1 Tax=Metschnikowia bicuspidata var. bicuspidata NRRL YB-4993 TaxID=869754 RepID=A0A1A0HE87_9ASCO|nr:hypothetical protein METBIDRAFT_39641 [Metschnikowia bicuspidata var. bicuspidata NRRL YB-4993]OBA22424.1 hypothetical protein METBIDRAFT_39641 [Metschnikowia bicuspidata var. bicuspidata NRRL YB-4993]
MDPALREQLDSLKSKKAAAQKKIHAELTKHRLSFKQAEGDEMIDEQPYSREALPPDPMDWSAEQWARHDRPQAPQENNTGYKNMAGLAHATYLKETAKRTVDMAQYEKSKAEQSLQWGDHQHAALVPSTPAAENVDALVKSLQEASERKQKRRTGEVADKQYVNEKNRQFNMKLDREYGK